MSSQHSSSHYQSPDNKKDEFRRYLEKSGAIESLTTVLVGLYEESDRPLESTEYIRRCLVGSDVSTTGRDGGGGASAGQQQENEKFKKENKEMKTKIHELNKTIETLRVNLKHAREEAKSAREEVRKLKSGKGGGS
jgi:peptidoglycan hydrolase CwlO-like protein